MKSLSMVNRFSAILLTCLFFITCRENKSNDNLVSTLPFYNDASFTPHWPSLDDIALDTFHRISPFALINQDGQQVTDKTFKNKIYVVDFFFTSCPGICPKMTDNMSIIQDEFIKDTDVLLLSHSVTPERDSVPVLRSYAEDKGIISSKWHLVTGAREVIYKLGRKD